MAHDLEKPQCVRNRGRDKNCNEEKEGEEEVRQMPKNGPRVNAVVDATVGVGAVGGGGVGGTVVRVA